MTVQELIEELSALPPEAEVYTTHYDPKRRTGSESYESLVYGAILMKDGRIKLDC